jgi:hypothetical protein
MFRARALQNREEWTERLIRRLVNYTVVSIGL